MKPLKVNLVDDFELVLDGPTRRERLQIRSPYYSRLYLSQFLFSQLGLMHLLAPYLPQVVKTDFLVHPLFQELISAMYWSCGEITPIFETPAGFHDFGTFPKTSSKKAVIAYSGGKDSMWNLWWAQEKYGPENVLAMHIRGLNQGQRHEAEYALRQSQEWGFNLGIIDLLNSSLNVGHAVMRSRDMFLTGLLIPLALDFGASRIITEGRVGNSHTLFTGQAENFRDFNRLIKKLLGIPVKVTWRYRKSMSAVKDLYLHRPYWMPLVCNCFAPIFTKPWHKSLWKERAPTFPLYESQCGSCVKCLQVNLGRLLYSSDAEKIDEKDVHAFLLYIDRWIRGNRKRVWDMIQGSFLREYQRACRRYGLDPNRLLK